MMALGDRINYDEPPVMVINGGDQYVNGRWSGRSAEFPALLGPCFIQSVRVWVWLDTGDTLPVDVYVTGGRALMRGDTFTVSDIALTP